MTRLAGLFAAVALILVVATEASAQAGWYVTPSLTLSEEFDDNVFYSSTSPRSDLVSRASPGVELGYKSKPFTLLARSSIDSEIYVDNTQLNDIASRKRAGLTFEYMPQPTLTLRLDATYLDTNTPSEIVPLTGLQLARAQSTELKVTPAVIYELSAVDTVRAHYTFIRDRLENIPGNELHELQLRYARQLTALDNVSVGYRLHVFETEDQPNTFTHTPTIRWTRQITPLWLLSIEAGPRFVDDGSVEPEVNARLQYTIKWGYLALDYYRSEQLVIGRAGKFEVESVTGVVDIEPIKNLRVRFEPGYYRTEVDPTAHVWAFHLSGVYPLTKWLSARLNYRYAHQAQGSDVLAHNIVTLSLDMGQPFRVWP
jgi:hypothetical protein